MAGDGDCARNWRATYPNRRRSLRPTKSSVSESIPIDGRYHPDDSLNVTAHCMSKQLQSHGVDDWTERKIAPEHGDGLREDSWCECGIQSSWKKNRYPFCVAVTYCVGCACLESCTNAGRPKGAWEKGVRRRQKRIRQSKVEEIRRIEGRKR